MSEIKEKLDRLDDMNIEAALNLLKDEKEIRHLIAENLVTRGPSIIDPVKRLLNSTLDLDLQINCALILFYFGNREGIPFMLRAIKDRTEWMCLAAWKLAYGKVAEAAPYILDQLRSLPVEKTDEIVALVLALGKLGSQMPKEIEDRLTATNVSWEIRSLFDEQIEFGGTT